MEITFKVIYFSYKMNLWLKVRWNGICHELRNLQRGINIFLMEDCCLVHSSLSLLGKRVSPPPQTYIMCTNVTYTPVHTWACLQLHLGFWSFYSLITMDFVLS